MDSASLSWFCVLVIFVCHFSKKIVFEHTLVTLYYLYRYYILDTAQLQVLQLCYKVKKNCQVLKSRKSYYKVRRCFADVVISLETTVWCSAQHTTKNIRTGLGVAKLWVQPQYVCSVECLIQIQRGFGRTAVNWWWEQGLHWGVQVLEGRSQLGEKYNERPRQRV